MSSFEITGKVCLVTGASRGIGAALARGLGANGASVAVHYRSGRAEAEAVAADVERGGKALLLQGDIAESGTPDRLVAETVARFGRLDILINNAGDQISRVDITETSDELFDRHVAINIRSVFAACRAAVRQFRRQPGGGGNIINVSSIAARTGGGGGSYLYAGAKGFISTFSRSLAKEVAAEGIRVNVVSPGVIATDMQGRVTSPEQLRSTATQIPMRRIGEPDDCTGAFLYLCSDRLSNYVTGQVIEVNGGLLMP